MEIKLLDENFIDKVMALESEMFGSANINEISNTLSSDVIKYYVLIDGDNLIGFLQGKIIFPEAEIYDIAIKVSEQGKGYSKLLMDYFISQSKSSGCETIFLEVNKMNNKALSLYESYKFYKYGERKNYYGNSDAILMKKDLI